MANKKISELPLATVTADTSGPTPIVQSTTTKREEVPLPAGIGSVPVWNGTGYTLTQAHGS